MKYLFLDIDGVLNSTRSCFVKIGPNLATSEAVRELAQRVSGGLPYGVTFALKCVDPICVELVNRLLKESGATLVLSSSHRTHLTDAHTPYASKGHLGRLRLYLECMGLYVPMNFDVTPVLHKPRGQEVEEFFETNELPENGGHGHPAYVILDDGADFHNYQPLVCVDASNGLSFENFASACTVLNISEPSTIIV
jgi:hypothetical protein